MLKFVGREEAGSSARRSTGSRQSAHSTVDPHPASAQYQLFLIAPLLLRLADGVNYLNGGKTVGSELRCQTRLWRNGKSVQSQNFAYRHVSIYSGKKCKQKQPDRNAEKD